MNQNHTIVTPKTDATTTNIHGSAGTGISDKKSDDAALEAKATPGTTISGHGEATTGVGKGSKIAADTDINLRKKSEGHGAA